MNVPKSVNDVPPTCEFGRALGEMLRCGVALVKVLRHIHDCIIVPHTSRVVPHQKFTLQCTGVDLLQPLFVLGVEARTHAARFEGDALIALHVKVGVVAIGRAVAVVADPLVEVDRVAFDLFGAMFGVGDGAEQGGHQEYYETTHVERRDKVVIVLWCRRSCIGY
jgi:hypothetical protein